MFWDASIDYIRCTYRSKADETVHSAHIRAIEGAGAYSNEGFVAVVPFKMQGFYGGKCGSAAWGYRDDGLYLLQGSGPAAQWLFDANLPYTNCSRIDLQATYWYDRDYSGLAASTAQLSLKARAGFAGRPWKINHINGMGQGDTTYIGTRGKDSKYLRCYDKWRQTERAEEYKYAWRYEAELTDKHANYALTWLRGAKRSQEVMLSFLNSYWQERGVELPNLTANMNVKTVLPRYTMDDVDRRLHWLETQVAPAIDKLIALGVSSDHIAGLLGLGATEP